MSLTVTIPEGFQYVGSALVLTVVVIQGLSITVGRYRKRAGIKYPQMYAEVAEVEKSNDAHLFNCAQRAHQNMLEQMPLVIITTVVSGLKYPIPTAIASVLWSISRISYARGYLTGDPAKRANPVYHVGSVSALSIFVSALYTAGSWVVHGLSSKV